MSEPIRISHIPPIVQKFIALNWGLVFLIVLLACTGFLALYSAAGGQLDPWASRQITRFCIGVLGMIIIAVIDIRIWYRLAYPMYAAGFISLVVVEIFGHIGMGAQRWINLGFIQIQPSEFMKIAVIMALAKYFHAAAPEDMRSVRFLLPAGLLIVAPIILVLLQPNLGMAVMTGAGGAAMLFLAGAPLIWFIGGGAAVVAAIPLIWSFMHDYQKRRVMTFLNPESDPLGAGYNIIQSKIALGSGGISGKGFLNGTQSHLNFLPEKQTDFIFTLWAEEWGLMGGTALILLIALILMYCMWIAFRCRHAFGRLLAYGLMINFSLYIFINVAMVMGLIPVVGIPFPLLSYGGTSMLAALVGFGLILSCSIHRDAKLPRM
jgi:rod shape determining protein RodA